MSTPETEPRRERVVIYIVVGATVVVLMVLGLVLYNSASSNREAQDKADQLIAALNHAGARTPDQDQIVRVLGTDGGATCTDPNADLNRAILLSQLTNGAAGPGARPVIADSRVFKFQQLVIEIYCPENMTDFQKFVSDLKTGDVAD
ncbi:hypothetical protein ACT8ZV_15905 [Nocardioides sp. MAHUQ-72]|uniref:hypothetical protein n=1 Tax=unclassified Nocardioides TaxID=2615069 RepID=UPI0036239AD4